MATTRVATAEDLLALPDDGWRYEIVDGEIKRMPPAGAEHGEIETRFIVALSIALRHPAGSLPDRGRVYPGDTGFIFSHAPLAIQAPDVAVVRAGRLPPLVERRGYLDLVPDLVVEIVSPSDRARDLAEKIDFFLGHGVPVAWVAFPDSLTGAIHRQGHNVRTLGTADAFTAEELLPGVRLPLAELYR